MTITLGDALMSGEGNAFDPRDPSIAAGIDKARDELDNERKKLNTGALGAGLKKAVSTALDIALDDILGQAWSGWKEIREYADPEKTPPDDVNIVSISNHTIESEHEPSVDVVVRGVTVHSFPFHVAAQIDVQGVNLVVQRGMIQEIRLGSLKMGGSVKLRDRTLLQKQVAQVEIPGVLRLENPIPILPDSA
jgi:hypothetical protein